MYGPCRPPIRSICTAHIERYTTVWRTLMLVSLNPLSSHLSWPMLALNLNILDFGPHWSCSIKNSDKGNPPRELPRFKYLSTIPTSFSLVLCIPIYLKIYNKHILCSFLCKRNDCARWIAVVIKLINIYSMCEKHTIPGYLFSGL